MLEELIGKLLLRVELLEEDSLDDERLETKALDAKLLCNELLGERDIKQACNNRLLDNMATVLMSERDIK